MEALQEHWVCLVGDLNICVTANLSSQDVIMSCCENFKMPCKIIIHHVKLQYIIIRIVLVIVKTMMSACGARKYQGWG